METKNKLFDLWEYIKAQRELVLESRKALNDTPNEINDIVSKYLTVNANMLADIMDQIANILDPDEKTENNEPVN